MQKKLISGHKEYRTKSRRKKLKGVFEFSTALLSPAPRKTSDSRLGRPADNPCA